MSISESVGNAGAGATGQDGKVSNRTLFSSMGIAQLSGLNIDMVRVFIGLHLCNITSGKRPRSCAKYYILLDDRFGNNKTLPT